MEAIRILGVLRLRAAQHGSGRAFRGAPLTMTGPEELQNRAIGRGRLVSRKDMAGLGQQDQLSSRNFLGDQFSIAGRNQTVALPVDHQGRRGYVRKTAVGFPSQDSLQLRVVSVRMGKPGASHFYIFFNPGLRSSRIIYEGYGGARSFVR